MARHSRVRSAGGQTRGREHSQITRRSQAEVRLPPAIWVCPRQPLRSLPEVPLRFRVLGCSGGSAPDHHPTCFLVDGKIAFDGGSLTNTLAEDEQENVDHVVLSHCHLDHVATLPFFIDNRFARLTRPINFYGHESTITDLKDGIFNNRIWPDFTQLKVKKSVALTLHAVEAGRPFGIEHLTITPSEMEHPVPCLGYLIESGGSSLYLAGDTGSAECVKRAVAGARNLKELVIEVSWPDRMKALAQTSGHLVPSDLKAAWPLHPTARVLVTHIKPFYREEVVGELLALGLPNSVILDDGMTFVA